MKKLIICGLLLYSSNSYGKGDTLMYSASIGAQYSDGNIKSHSFNAFGELKGLRKKNDWSIAPSYKYLISYPYPILPTSTPSKQNEFYMASHISYRFNSPWKIMVFSEVEHSQLRKINIRYNLGIGPAYKLIQTGNTKLEISDVMMLDDYESMVIKNALPEKNNLSLRTSLRLKFIYTNEGVTISSIQTLQPSLVTWTKDPNASVGWADNTNFRSINSIEVRVIAGFCFGLSVDYVYQSYLNYISKDPIVEKSGIYLSPQDISIVFYLKYKSK